MSWTSLFAITAVALSMAMLAAWLGRPVPREAWADAGAAGMATLAAVAVAASCYGLSARPDAPSVWRELGSWALLASPVTAAAALRMRGRRSTPRALLVGSLALAAVVVWLTLRMKGVRGGWTPGEIALVSVLTITAVASAACCGWWSKRDRTAGPS